MKDAKRSLNLEPEVVVVHKGRLKRIRKPIDLEHIAVDDIETGACDIVKISEVAVLAKELPPQEKPKRAELMLVSEADWKIARKRLEIIEPLLDKQGRTREDVEARAKEYGRDPTTLYRWINDYEPTHALESLLPKQQSAAKGKKRLGKIRNGIVDIAVAKYPTVLTTMHDVWLEVEASCKRLQLEVPDEGTIRNRILNLPLADVLAGKRGRKAARDKFDPKVDKYDEATYPLSIYQIDHLRVPTHIVDEKYRKPIGKAYITLVIDVWSRVIPGFAIILESPGNIGLGLAMGHCILPKDTWLATRNLTVSWPVWGVPRVIHADNAKEFRGKTLELAADNLKTSIEWRWVKTPEYGGHIERLCGTLKAQLKKLPGGEERPGKRNEDEDAEAEACLTLRELEVWVALEIAKYHGNPHSGIGDVPPLTRFMEGILGTPEQPGKGYPPRITDERWLRLQWTPWEYRTIQQYGIQWDGVHYWDPALAPYINTIDPETNKARKFICRRDPRDISRIYVWIPELDDHIDIPYRTPSHPAVTVWELRAAQAALRKKGQDAMDEEATFRVIEQQREIVAGAAEKTKSARRTQQRTAESQRGVKESGVNSSLPKAEPKLPELDYSNVTAYQETDDESL